MSRFRAFLVSLIAPCSCVVEFDTGEVFIWRTVDASRCNRRGHRNNAQVVGSR